MRDPLVVGVGNLDRGDDAAGIIAVRDLNEFRTKEVRDCSGLIDLWEAEESSVVIDAMQSGRPPGSVLIIDVHTDRLPAQAFPSTHSFGLSETVELARTLGRLPGELVIYGIEAAKFDHGAPVSNPVLEAVDIVVTAIRSEAK